MPSEQIKSQEDLEMTVIDPQRIIGVGCLATLITGFLMSLLPQAGLPHSDIYVILASIFNTTSLDTGSGTWFMCMGVHFLLGGIVFPLLYTIFVYPRMSIAPILRGMLWGTALWAFNMAFLMPFCGLGFFASAHPMQGAFIAESLFIELIWGALIGELLAPEEIAQTSMETQDDYILHTATGQPFDERKRMAEQRAERKQVGNF